MAAAAPTGEGKATEPAKSVLRFDSDELQRLREANPWAKSPYGVKRVKVSSVAVMKMLMHAKSGVERGLKSTGTPVEVMGIMIGRPDFEDHEVMLVTDVFPLPVEGAETKVLADDQEVMNHMINLSEALESTRKEVFMGWYHSHPFDVGVMSHCFFSSTDVSTQLSWQRSEDPHGNPWIGIVIDPLRSMAKRKPELAAFRVLPPEYDPPTKRMPDGKVPPSTDVAQERWGPVWDRYYALDVEYFTGGLGSSLLKVMSRNFLWTTKLASTPMLEAETRDRMAERVSSLASDLRGVAKKAASRRGMSSVVGTLPSSAHDEGRLGSVLARSTQASGELAREQCGGEALQIAKWAVFAPGGVGGSEEAKEQ